MPRPPAGTAYLQSLPYVDKDGVGTFGVSHSGELMMKAASEITFAAAVAVEGAAHEYLGVDRGPKAPRKGTEIQYQDVEVVRRAANKAIAMKRIRRINTPFLHVCRDQDHLQGIFKLAHEWMKEAGKDSTWVSFDHPVHGYPFIYADKDGTYRPDPIQQRAFGVMLAFFDKHLKHAHAPEAQKGSPTGLIDGLEARFVDAGGVSTRYCDYGRGDPLVLLRDQLLAVDAPP